MANEISTQIVREAPEIEAYKLGLLKEAQSLYGKPMNLPAIQTAGLSPGQKQAAELARQGIGAWQPNIEAGEQSVVAGMGVTADAANSFQGARGLIENAVGGYNPNVTAEFMNPYQEMVTQNALREMRRQGDIAANTTAAQAVNAGAFGSTREGVQRAEQERNLQDLMSQRVFQDYAANFGQAQTAGMTAFEAARQRELAAAAGIGSLATQGANVGATLGTLGVQQGALGQSKQQLTSADVNLMSGVGALEQAAAQDVLNAERATKLQETMAPYQQLGFVSDIYKSAPTSQMSMTASSAPSATPIQSALGTVVGGVTTAAAASRAGLF
jgi:hypothetical protein